MHILYGKLHATTVIESRYKRKIAQYRLSNAIELFNETIQKLGFIYKAKITLSGGGHVIKRLFPHKYPYSTCLISTSRYSINVDHGKLTDKIVLLEPKMIPILNKGLAYYQCALESDNPHIKTMLLVSCISSIIMGQYNKKYLELGDLIYHLDKIRPITRMRKTAFKNFIEKIYGLRSKPAHGNVDIKDKMEISESNPSYKKFHKIVDIYIEKFLDDQQRPVESAQTL